MEYKAIGVVSANIKDFPFFRNVEQDKPNSILDLAFTLVPAHLEHQSPWYHAESIYKPVLYNDKLRAAIFALKWLDCYPHSLPSDVKEEYVTRLKEIVDGAK